MVKTNTKHQNSSTHTSMTKFVYFIVYIFVADAASTAHDDTAVVAEAEINSLDGSTTTTVVNNNNNNSSWNSLMKQIFGGGGEKDGGGNTSSSSSASDSNDDDGGIFESIGEAVVPTYTHTEECRSQDGEQNECSSSDQKQHNEELAENAESIWKFLGIAAGKKDDDQPQGQKTTKEAESAVEQEGEEDESTMTMDAWQSVLLQARKYHAERQKTGDSTPFEEKVHAVYNVFTRIVEQFKNQFGKLQLEKFNFMQLWYVLQNEERLKDPVYKRQQHRFFDPISEDQALELADALYLNGVAYSDSCEEIEYY
mmetsp:Transcript_24943/g.59260  ORF Transcript_24943/g.59260 Transcript_24943/m.59260 type:complete len:311 (-) Transcript_24943:2976-3908(-)